MIANRVAISGKMTSGKTTCSEYLIKRYGYKRVSFATPIKEIAAWFRMYQMESGDDKLSLENQLFHMMVQIFKGDVSKGNQAYEYLMNKIFPRFQNMDWSLEKNNQWRQLLQDIGNGLRENVSDTIWVDYLIYSLNPDELYICDDVRYQNEFGIMLAHGFTMIRLNVSPEVQVKRIEANYGALDPVRLQHPSEIDLDLIEFPFVINSDKELHLVLHDIEEIVEGANT